jgi:DNA replication and repair protein RecF
LDIPFDNAIILIEGMNGAGKTSFLEALHYLCYLRSFRTHMPQELIHFGQDNFFIKARISNQAVAATDSYDLQVGFSNKKRLVKINNKSVSSYKELLDYYRIVTLTEDDLALIKGGPEERRLFIDQAIMLCHPEFVVLSKRCKDVVENRNALLKRGGSADSYQLWTEQLWQITHAISHERIRLLAQIEETVSTLITTYFKNEFTITLGYSSKKELCSSYQEFADKHPFLYQDEQRFGRSLFGAHLDDFAISFQEAKSKNYASRGQQKLIVMLLKAAQVHLILAQKGSVILLLDDFMTDFDQSKAHILLQLLSDLKVQLIFTMPTSGGFLQQALLSQGAALLKLTN